MKNFLEFIGESRVPEEAYVWYVGIGDSDGIDALLRIYSESELQSLSMAKKLNLSEIDGPAKAKSEKEALSQMTTRAHYNAQRHPVVFKAKLTIEVADYIETLFRTDPAEALIALKNHASEIQLAKVGGVNVKRAWDAIPNKKLNPIEESLNYHIEKGLSIAESIYRPGSRAHIRLLNETRKLYDGDQIELKGIDEELFSQTDLGLFGLYEGMKVPLDLVLEAEYNGKPVELNKPMRGGTKKYYVYVMNPKTKRVKKIAFGDVHGGLTAKVSNPKARKSFAARHQCHLKNDKLKAGYWACRINRYAHLWGGKTYPGYW